MPERNSISGNPIINGVTTHKQYCSIGFAYYYTKAAEVALKALKGSEIAGKRIKFEQSRPGGARRSMMQQLVKN
ncbi:unnamed protein product [Lactuca virosa]|uniref:Uncharacterized protein n=1 Tax=Lactuca virosa TaxID=75947 RepID=A0AAU9NBA3_9ASTR|nr:unnamed protein product [Lactuca virosa]